MMGAVRAAEPGPSLALEYGPGNGDFGLGLLFLVGDKASVILTLFLARLSIAATPASCVWYNGRDCKGGSVLECGTRI
jgi:hypothetical protein